MDSLKYWRSRFFLLPTNQSATKKIQLPSTTRCDIYDVRLTEEEEKRRLETFTRFLTIVNRLRRQPQKAPSSSAASRLQLAKVPSRKTSPSNLWQVQSAKFSTTSQLFQPTATELRASRRSSSTEAPDVASLTQTGGSGHGGGASGGSSGSGGSGGSGISATIRLSGRGTSLPSPRSRVGTKSDDAIASNVKRQSDPDNQLPQLDPVWTASPSIQLDVDNILHMHSPLTEVLAAMTSREGGLPFLVSKPAPNLPELPEFCFISYEAIHWARGRIEGVQTVNHSVNILQRMIDAGLICHASGSFEYPFKFGFYFYYVVDVDTNNNGSLPQPKDENLHPSKISMPSAFSSKTSSKTPSSTSLLSLFTSSAAASTEASTTPSSIATPEVSVSAEPPRSPRPEDLRRFQNEWLEVDCELGAKERDIPAFLLPRLSKGTLTPRTASYDSGDQESEVSGRHSAVGTGAKVVGSGRSSAFVEESKPAITWTKPSCTYKNVSINPDLQSLSKYPEFGNLRYASSYGPNCPFEMEFQWMACSGPLLNELIAGWRMRLRQISEGETHFVPGKYFAKTIT